MITFGNVKRYLLLLLFAFSSFANQVNQADNYQLTYDEKAAVVEYGEYSEVEFTIEGNLQDRIVQFDIVEPFLPPGMEIRPITYNKAIIFGVPLFVDQWCFLIEAQVTRSGSRDTEVVTKRACIFSHFEEDSQLAQFTTKSFLDPVESQKNFNKFIQVSERTKRFEGEMVAGDLPQSVEISFDQFNSRFKISGFSGAPETYEFVLMLKDTQFDFNNPDNFEKGQLVYKQFTLSVEEQLVIGDDHYTGGTEPVSPYLCPAGYFYSYDLGYCLPVNNITCGQGTFYEPQSNSCIAYPAAPAGLYCGPGTYFDHFLNRCVRLSYNRCPWNYEYSPYYGRCVRSPYTCSFGQRYDWTSRTCYYPVWWRTTCGSNSYYDHFLGRCVFRGVRYCGVGYYWSYGDGWGTFNSCRRRAPYCSYGSFYSPYSQGCVARVRYSSCRYGYRYDYGFNSCRPVYNFNRCSYGYHYNGYSCRANRIVVRPVIGYRPVIRYYTPIRQGQGQPIYRRPAPVNRPVVRPRPTPPNRGGNVNRPTPTPPNRGGNVNRPPSEPTRGGNVNRPTPTPPNRGGNVNRPPSEPTRGGNVSRPTPTPPSRGGSVNRPSQPSEPTRGGSGNSGPNRPNRGRN